MNPSPASSVSDPPDTPAGAAGAVSPIGPVAAEPPRLACWLGYAGLAPFAGGALLIWFANPEALPFAAQALSTYAALIASFLGGIHWGLALREPRPSTLQMAWGVVPSILGWIGAMMPASSGLVVGGGVLLLAWLVDRKVYPSHGAARWLTLRFRLSAGASLCCFIGAAGT
jgi:hypothetical protein